MTRSKSWARRRAVQVLRAARLPGLSWGASRVSGAEDVDLARVLHAFEWLTWGGYLWHADPCGKGRFERVSSALLSIQREAGLRDA